MFGRNFENGTVFSTQNMLFWYRRPKTVVALPLIL